MNTEEHTYKPKPQSGKSHADCQPENALFPLIKTDIEQRWKPSKSH